MKHTRPMPITFNYVVPMTITKRKYYHSPVEYLSTYAAWHHVYVKPKRHWVNMVELNPIVKKLRRSFKKSRIAFAETIVTRGNKKFIQFTPA